MKTTKATRVIKRKAVLAYRKTQYGLLVATIATEDMIRATGKNTVKMIKSVKRNTATIVDMVINTLETK